MILISNEELVSRVNERFASFEKSHPEEDFSDLRGWIRNQIRLRVKRGIEITDTKLENVIRNERQRVAKRERFKDQIRILEETAPPHLKGLASGLSGLSSEE
jgi:hypothetical protein